MPDVSPMAWSRVAVRAVIALCVFTLLATAVAVGAIPATAADYSGQISANRSSQAAYERSMREQDSRLIALKREKKATKKALKRAKKGLKRSKQVLAARSALLSARRERLAVAEAAYLAARAEAEAAQSADPVDPTAEPTPEPPKGPTVAQLKARMKETRKSVRVAERRKVAAAKRMRTLTRQVKAKKARLGYVARQRRAAIARRESAEAVLAARITQMTELAAGRVENQASVSYASGTAFSWPTTGRISQTYGCTGFPFNPRRGSCRHFHDGIDIVDGHGTPVRSVAVGVVAYAGWNPWDENGRAWIIVVVHPDGWVSRYGHLEPTKHVRVGQLVYTGQIIGKMGNTGKSTGTHLHFELLRGRDDVNPLSYLPAGVVKIKVDKTSTKKGLSAAKAKARKKAQAAKARKKAKAARAAAEAAEPALTAGCEPASLAQPLAEDLYGITGAEPPAGDVCVESSDTEEGAAAAALATAAFAGRPAVPPEPDPGVHLPLRGTSPIPA